MKRIRLFYIGILFPILSASAQVKLGVETGMNLSHYKTSNRYQAEKKGGMGAGFEIGGTVDYEFQNHWMLMSGASFMQTQSNMKLADATIFHFPDTEIKLNHFVVPIKVGYNIRANKNISIIPFIGVYGSYDFSAGRCSLKAGEKADKWKPMSGYSFSVPNTQLPFDYKATINPFRHWTYGGIGGVKAVIANHYTASLQYYEAIKKVQKQCSLRNYGYQLSVGYQF